MTTSTLQQPTRDTLLAEIAAHPTSLRYGRYNGIMRSSGGWSQTKFMIEVIGMTDLLTEPLLDEPDIPPSLHPYHKFREVSCVVQYLRPRGNLSVPFTGWHSNDTGEFTLEKPSESMLTSNGVKAAYAEFFTALAQCTLKLLWHKNQQPSMIYGPGWLMLTGTHKEQIFEAKYDINNALKDEKGKVAEAAASASGASSTTTTTTSPASISSQSNATLALVCRFLNGGELLSMYKTNRLLSAAAASPVTHQSSGSVMIDSSFDHPRSYVIDGGMTCTFAHPQKMLQAFASRLFHHTRSVRLRPDWSTLYEALKALISPQIPPLRTLRFETPFHYGETPNVTLMGMSQSSSYSFLKLLHLSTSLSIMSAFLDELPPSVEVLHLSFLREHARGHIDMPENIVHALKKSTCSVKRLLIDANDVTLKCSIKSLQTLGQIEEEIPRIEELVVMAVISPFQLIAEGIILASLPIFKKLTSICLNARSIDSEFFASFLTHFPLLTQLELHDLESMSDFSENVPSAYRKTNPRQKSEFRPVMDEELQGDGDVDILHVWPESIQHSLTYLRVCVTSNIEHIAPRLLSSSGLANLQKFEIHKSSKSNVNIIGGTTNFVPFWSRPLIAASLHTLSLSALAMKINDFSRFSLLPNLTSLVHIRWPSAQEDPYEHALDRAVIFDEKGKWLGFRDCLSALTELHVEQATKYVIDTRTLRTIPNLTRLKWLTEEWLHSKQAIEERLVVADQEAERAAQLKRGDAADKIQQPSSYEDEEKLRQGKRGGRGFGGIAADDESEDDDDGSSQQQQQFQQVFVPSLGLSATLALLSSGKAIPFDATPFSFGVPSTATSAGAAVSSTFSSSFTAPSSSSFSAPITSKKKSSLAKPPASHAAASSSSAASQSALSFAFGNVPTSTPPSFTTIAAAGGSVVNPFLSFASSSESSSSASSAPSNLSAPPLFSFGAPAFAPPPRQQQQTITPAALEKRAAEIASESAAGFPANVEEDELRHAFEAFALSFQQDKESRPRAPGGL